MIRMECLKKIATFEKSAKNMYEFIYLSSKTKTNNDATARHPDNGLNWIYSSAGPRQDLPLSTSEVTSLAVAAVCIIESGLLLRV